MEQVIKLTREQRDNWRGIYNGEGFDPVEDENGNWVCSVQCASNQAYPFMNELSLLERIDYYPKTEYLHE